MSESKLEKMEEILIALDMLDEVQNNKTLNFVAKELISSKNKDYTSIIYRLSMAIFHSARVGEPVLKEFFDPLGIYMKITENKIFDETDPEFLEKLRGSKDPSHLIRTFIAYLSASYLYYKNVGEA